MELNNWRDRLQALRKYYAAFGIQNQWQIGNYYSVPCQFVYAKQNRMKNDNPFQY